MNDVLNKRYPRRFVPPTADLADWAQVEPLFDRLDERPLDSVADLERWILDQSELAACLREEGTKRYVAMTCQTDDAAREQAHLHFIEQIEPRCKPRWHRLRLRYVGCPLRERLPKDRWAVYDRSAAAAVEIFREANVALQTDDEKLDQQYQKLCGAMTVTYDGREQTLQQMARYLREPDRAVREQAWRLVAERRLADRDAIDAIFDPMIALRDRIARNADLADFRDYQFKAYERFDYGPADCFAFHDSIERLAMPVVGDLQRRRRELLGVETLRPWDSAVDPRGRPPLAPFKSADELCEKCRETFARLDRSLGGQFAAMVSAGWLDLDSRKGKAPGGYQASFDESRRPFIFMNAVGLHGDVETLLHEGGHAFHAVACRDEPLIHYRHCGMEMAEVASMGMELLAGEHIDVFYAGEELVRARREKFEDILALLPWVATIDAFQHWLYTHPGHSRDERTAQWRELMDRFGGQTDWRGLEHVRDALWQRQLHLFGVPFYYIEYGIAQIGALQLWRNFRADPAAALGRYKQALALGGSRPLPELWAAAGLTFDFSADTLGPLIDLVCEELDRLAD